MLRIIKIQIYVFLVLVLVLEFSLRGVYFNLKSDNYFAISSFIKNIHQRLIGKVNIYKHGAIGLYDPVLGYTYLPGEHYVHMTHLDFLGKVKSELKAIETVNSEGYRITNKLPSRLQDYKTTRLQDYKTTRPELWIMGCSFTFGSYLNDDQTFPWLIQKEFSSYEVKNYSRGGYGQLHYLLQLEKLLKDASGKRSLPKVIILTYTRFHQERNIQSDDRLFRLKDHPGLHVYSYKLPAARVNSKNQLEIYYKGLSDIIDRGKPKMDTVVEQNFEGEKVTIAIFDRISKLADAYQVKIIVSSFEPKSNDSVLDYLNKNRYDVLYNRIDWNDKKYNLLPFDPHPNALANQKWSETLIEKLKTIL